MLRPSPGLGRQYLISYAKSMARNGRLLASEYGVVYTVPNARMPKKKDRNDSTPGQRGRPLSLEGSLWQYTLPVSHAYSAIMAECYIEEWLKTRKDPCPYDQFEKFDLDY